MPGRGGSVGFRVSQRQQPGRPLAFRPLPHSLPYVALAALVALLALERAGVPLRVVAWAAVAAGVAVVLLGIVAAWRSRPAEPMSEAGVTGAALVHPVFIPWSEVVRVGDDRDGVTVYAARRSVRIDLVSAWVQARPVYEYADTDAVVRFILAHVPKDAMVEMTYFLPG